MCLLIYFIFSSPIIPIRILLQLEPPSKITSVESSLSRSFTDDPISITPWDSCAEHDLFSFRHHYRALGSLLRHPGACGLLHQEDARMTSPGWTEMRWLQGRAGEEAKGNAFTAEGCPRTRRNL
jgi:hypothetical protein